MNAVESVLEIERKKIIEQLKSVTNSSTGKQLDAAIPVWKEFTDSQMFGAIMHAPNRDEAVLDACKKLRLKLNSSPIPLFYALNCFRAYHGYYEYLSTMMEHHEKHWALMMEKCPVGFLGKK